MNRENDWTPMRMCVEYAIENKAQAVSVRVHGGIKHVGLWRWVAPVDYFGNTFPFWSIRNVPLAQVL